MRKLRIAQLSTPFISVPPKNYGGTELVVANITEELVKRGHEVTLFAPGDSHTAARLQSSFPISLNLEKMKKEFSAMASELFWMHSLPTIYHAVEPFEKAQEYDVIHNHLHYLGLFFAQFVKTPTIHTYHGDFCGALKSPIENMILEKYKNQFWTAISQTQKKNCTVDLNFQSVIHHGIPIERFNYNEEPQDYLVWLGRITPKKGITDAIQVAHRLDKKLIIAGVVNPIDQEFFDTEIKPLLDDARIVFHHGLNFEEKVDLFKNAFALLYPVRWEEPFGLVMIEAMATGTPVVGYAHGAVTEIVEDGKTGLLVDQQPGKINQWIIKKTGIDGLEEAVKYIYDLPALEYRQMRKQARTKVENSFTVQKMVDKYEQVYLGLL